MSAVDYYLFPGQNASVNCTVFSGFCFLFEMQKCYYRPKPTLIIFGRDSIPEHPDPTISKP
jgi:hypothetical protein